MFPDWNQARRRLGASLDDLAGRTWFRIAVAVVLASFHLAMFAKAGHERLGLPFNSDSAEAPYFENIHATSTIGYPREPKHWSRLIVSRWDAQHYIEMSVRGLSVCPTDNSAPDMDYLQCGLGWLPAWGKVSGTISGVTGVPDDIVLMFLSVFATIAINLMWTSPLIARRIGKPEAYATALAFTLFPSAFHLVTPYAEAATLVLVLGAFFALVEERWILAGALVGAATALKISAIAFSVGLGIAAIYAVYRRRERRAERWWWPLLALPLCGWGQIVEVIMMRIYTGDAMAFWRAREAFGDSRDFSRLTDSEYFMKGFGSQHMDMVILVGVLGIIALNARDLLRKFSRVEALYIGASSAIGLVMIIVAPLVYCGMDRYLLLVPLAFLCMGAMVRKHTAVLVMWLLLCLAFYWNVELCSYVAQGDPRVCPCLGRLEFTFPFGS
jgi:hypothetical protein